MKFTTLVLGLLATSTHALNQGAKVPRCQVGDVRIPSPAHEPCTDCVRTWHPPHNAETDGCGDFGNGEWHWIRPAPKPSSTSTVTVAHVKTIVDCAGHKAAVATVTASSGMIIDQAAISDSQPTATGNSTPEDRHVTSASSPTSVHTPVLPQIPVTISLSSVRFGWKGSYDASSTISTFVETPFPTPVNSSFTYRPHTPVTTIQPAPYRYNATTAAPAIPTITNTPQVTSGACSSMYHMQILALVGLTGVLAL